MRTSSAASTALRRIPFTIPFVPVYPGTTRAHAAVGAHSALPSVLGAGAVIVVVSMILAFLSGMNIRWRVLTNLVVLAAAAAITYGIGIATQRLWGIAA